MAGAASDDDHEISAINVTPLVDITLVLLIIFMVTTTAINKTEGLAVNKPEAATGSTVEGASILIECDGTTVLVDGSPAPDDQAVVAAVASKLSSDGDLQGIVQCDESAPVGSMVHLIDLMREAGVKRYAIATKPPAAQGS